MKLSIKEAFDNFLKRLFKAMNSSNHVIKTMILTILFAYLLSSVLACSKQKQACAVVMDGINLQSTPALLVELESLNISVTLAVSMNDLLAFEAVRMIAREAVWRGHTIALSSLSGFEADWPAIKREWLEATGSELKYSLPGIASKASGLESVNFNLDLTPDYVTNVPQLVHEQLKVTPQTGRIVYANSFVPGINAKVMDAIQAYQYEKFTFLKLDSCI